MEDKTFVSERSLVYRENKWLQTCGGGHRIWSMTDTLAKLENGEDVIETRDLKTQQDHRFQIYFCRNVFKRCCTQSSVPAADSSEDIIDKLIDEVSEDTKDKPSDVDHIQLLNWQLSFFWLRLIFRSRSCSVPGQMRCGGQYKVTLARGGQVGPGPGAHGHVDTTQAHW